MKYIKSQRLYQESCVFMPGGVNSPVRAFKSVKSTPLFIKKAKGAYLYDEDGNQYIDFINSWGPMILGHAYHTVQEALQKALGASFSFGAPTKKELEIARLLVEIVPSLEQVRMVNSGTEATMAAIRLARGFTRKNKIIKFEGCYHGHGDSFLIKAGSGAMTMGEPDSAGVTPNTSKDTLTASFNDLDSVQKLIDQNKFEIAALIVEPVVGNMGLVLPKNDFLGGLRKLCTKHDIILIFDEVMTGFRLALGGAQERYAVLPDLTTLGKIIGGGLPVGAYGGRRDIMQHVSPQGSVYQAGTLSGNPLAMTAGLTTLQYLYENKKTVYSQLEQTGKNLAEGIRHNLKSLDLNYKVNQIGSMFSLFFTENETVNNFTDVKTCSLEDFNVYFHNMLAQGIYLAPSQFESLFFSLALGQKEVDHFLKANYNSLKTIKEKRSSKI